MKLVRVFTFLSLAFAISGADVRAQINVNQVAVLRWQAENSATTFKITAFNITAHAQDSSDVSLSATAPAASIWTAMNTPNPGGNNFLFAIDGDSQNDIWAVGSQVPGSLALHFNGTSWSAVAAPNVTELEGVAVLSPTSAWAVGANVDSNFHHSPVIQHFDGIKWTLISSPQFAVGASLFGIKAISATNVFAVGEANNDFGSAEPLVEHFDGTSWSVVSVPTATASLFGLSVLSASDIWAVGALHLDQVNHDQPFALHFDGNHWSIVPVPAPTNSMFSKLLGVTGISKDDVWAVGNFQTSALNTLTEHWNGTAWTIVSSPNVGSSSGLHGVAAISSKDVWASGCGPCFDAGAGQHALIEHWNGTRWSVSATPLVAAGDIGSSVLAFPPGSVFVAGTAAAAGNPRFRTLVLHTTQGQ